MNGQTYPAPAADLKPGTHVSNPAGPADDAAGIFVGVTPAGVLVTCWRNWPSEAPYDWHLRYGQAKSRLALQWRRHKART